MNTLFRHGSRLVSQLPTHFFSRELVIKAKMMSSLWPKWLSGWLNCLHFQFRVSSNLRYYLSRDYNGWVWMARSHKPYPFIQNNFYLYPIKKLNEMEWGRIGMGNSHICLIPFIYLFIYLKFLKFFKVIFIIF